MKVARSIQRSWKLIQLTVDATQYSKGRSEVEVWRFFFKIVLIPSELAGTQSMDDHWQDEETQTEAEMHTQAIEAGWSSTEDPETCACRGRGWILSQLDTWHACPVHHVKGQRHPEDDDDEELWPDTDLYAEPTPFMIATDEHDDCPF